jgi:uncharacterized protein (DUF488 family)
MKTLYSIGHSNHNITEFCDLLHNSKIHYLVDIRSVPFSKFYPQFNQNMLIKSLEAEHIQYIFLGNELGGRINDISCYINDTIPGRKIGYASFLNYEVICTKEWFTLGITKLLDTIDKGTCAIMCSEENPEQCHRELIVGRKLKELGYTVTHIRSNLANPAQLKLFE